MAVLIIFVPVLMFLTNAVFNVLDEGDGNAPFPYFKLVIFFAIIAVGLIAHLMSHLQKQKLSKRKPTGVLGPGRQEAGYARWDAEI